MFSLSPAIAWALFFSAFFCPNLALAAAALSGGRGFLILEPSKLESRLEATLASAVIDLCRASSPEVRDRIIAGLGGLDGITNIEGRGLA